MDERLRALSRDPVAAHVVDVLLPRLLALAVAGESPAAESTPQEPAQRKDVPLRPRGGLSAVLHHALYAVERLLRDKRCVCAFVDLPLHDELPVIEGIAEDVIDRRMRDAAGGAVRPPFGMQASMCRA